jgi:hypothetical protein
VQEEYLRQHMDVYLVLREKASECATEWVRRSDGFPSPSTDYVRTNYQKNAHTS